MDEWEGEWERAIGASAPTLRPTEERTRVDAAARGPGTSSRLAQPPAVLREAGHRRQPAHRMPPDPTGDTAPRPSRGAQREPSPWEEADLRWPTLDWSPAALESDAWTAHTADGVRIARLEHEQRSLRWNG